MAEKSAKNQGKSRKAVQDEATSQDNFLRIDFQLLRIFRAVMHHRQLTAAASDLGLTQSALSHALRRLSDLFGQPLFRRTRQGMQPTPFAETIAEEVENILGAAEAAFGAQDVFTPTDRTTFRIAMVGEMATVYAARLSRLIAPTPARLEMDSLPFEKAFSALLERKTDLILSPALNDDPRLEQLLVMSTPWVAAVEKGHGVLSRKKDMSLKKYLACRHVGLAVPDMDMAAHTLAASGLSRDVRITVPSARAALEVASESDFVASVPKALAQPFAKTRNLRLMPLPVETPPYALYGFWLKARTKDPMLGFLTRAITGDWQDETGEEDEDD